MAIDRLKRLMKAPPADVALATVPRRALFYIILLHAQGRWGECRRADSQDRMDLC